MSHFLRLIGLFGLLIVCGVGSAQGEDGVESTYLLESYPSYSLLLPLSHETPRNETFLVQSPRFHKVMAVIQFLNLPPKNDFTCGTYIQFHDGQDSKSSQICGNFDPEERNWSPPSLIGPRSYISAKDQLKVSFIHTIAGKLDNSYARISFTAYRDDCYFHQGQGQGQGQPRYRPCEYATSSDGIGRICIVSSLFCDSVLNCGPTEPNSGTDFGQDESEVNCPQFYQNVEYSPPAPSSGEEEEKKEKRGEESQSSSDQSYKRFFDEREEHLANIFKSAIIGFVGICTICIIAAFIISIFCWKNNYSIDS